ncbi:ankyrin repeat-containing domain protein, partial [Baffinella frigidus]
HLEIVINLLSAGANKEAMDADGCTPLLLAACSGAEGVVRKLLSAGAEKEAKNKVRREGFPGVRRGGRRTCMAQRGKTPLLLSALSGCEAVVDVLLAAGADTDAKDEDGWTALHFTSFGVHEAIVEKLLVAGADT